MGTALNYAPQRAGVPYEPSFMDVLLSIGLPEEVAGQFENVRLPFELRPHQYNSLQGMLAWDRMGLFDQTRTGKTVVMHLAAIYLAKYGYKSIFLMPPILFDQFSLALGDIGSHGLRATIFNQGPVRRINLLKKIREGELAMDVLIMTKEIFKSNLTELMAAGFNALFFDECHMGLQKAKMKTPKGERTTYGSVKFFIDNTQNGRLVLATGTPIYNEIIGTYPLISLKTPNAYRNETDFQLTHVTFKQMMIRTPRGVRTIAVPDSNNYLEVELLTENLHKQATRARKLEVLDMRVPNVQEVPIHLNPKHMALYKQVVTERVLEVGSELVDARSSGQLRSLAMQIITDPSIAVHPAPQNTIVDAINTLFNSIDVKHNKVLLFATYNRSVEALAKAFKALNPAVVYGPNGAEKNRASANRFITSDDCRILIANPQAGGVGLTLGGICQNVIFVEPVSTPGEFDQAASRVILDKQTEPVSVYILRILNTISPKTIDVMLGRMAQSKQVSKDKKSLLDELLGEEED